MFNFLKKVVKTQATSAPTTRGTPAVAPGGLATSSKKWLATLKEWVVGKQALEAHTLTNLEHHLLTLDLGPAVTTAMMQQLRDALAQGKDCSATQAMAVLKKGLLEILQTCEQEWVLPPRAQQTPYIILCVGANGVGKTTTIGKLAHRLRQQGLKVMLAAGDTFRAAAVEQLKIWGERNAVPVIAQQAGADSAAVIYDAVSAAKARNMDVLIADTAGRLHTQQGLIEELKKVQRTIKKIDATGPQEVLLILDGTIGQNSIAQVQEFNRALQVTGLVITKLDGTAKGGAIFAIARDSCIPIRFLGVGEGVEDLQPFCAQDFVAGLFEEAGGAHTPTEPHSA